MALVTTFMAAPAIRLLDPRGTLASPVEEELQGAVGERPAGAPEPEGAILVAPLAERNVDELLAIAEPLAIGLRPREVIIVRPVAPPRVPTQLAASARDRRGRPGAGACAAPLVPRVARMPTRSLAFTSAVAGADVVRLAREEAVDLLLVDGRRPLLGAGPARGDADDLRDAPCDVAVLMEREGLPPLDADHPVVVAYDGTQETALGLARRLSERSGRAVEARRRRRAARGRGSDGGARRRRAAAGVAEGGARRGPARRSPETSPTLLVRPATVPSS